MGTPGYCAITQKWTGSTKITLLQCPLECRGLKLPKPPEAEVDLEPGDRLYGVFIPEEWAAEYIHATTTPSQQLAEQAQADMEWTFAEMVPEAYHDFADVFSKDAFNKLPPWKPWDHAINLTPDTDLPCAQTFPLSPAEQKELDEFLKENLSNGWADTTL